MCFTKCPSIEVLCFSHDYTGVISFEGRKKTKGVKSYFHHIRIHGIDTIYH
jgi:hypothetical protein